MTANKQNVDIILLNKSIKNELVIYDVLRPLNMYSSVFFYYLKQWPKSRVRSHLSKLADYKDEIDGGKLKFLLIKLLEQMHRICFAFNNATKMLQGFNFLPFINQQTTSHQQTLYHYPFINYSLLASTTVFIMHLCYYNCNKNKKWHSRTYLIADMNDGTTIQCMHVIN